MPSRQCKVAASMTDDRGIRVHLSPPRILYVSAKHQCFHVTTAPVAKYSTRRDGLASRSPRASMGRVGDSVAAAHIGGLGGS